MTAIICFECGHESPSGSNYCRFCHRHLRHWYPIEILEASQIPPTKGEDNEMLNVQFWPFDRLNEIHRLANRHVIDQICRISSKWLATESGYEFDYDGKRYLVSTPHAAFIDAELIIDVWEGEGDPRIIRGRPRLHCYAVFPATIINALGPMADLVFDRSGNMRVQVKPRQKYPTNVNYEIRGEELGHLYLALQSQVALTEPGSP